MQSFYRLNRSKIQFAFVFISILSICITTAIMFIAGLFKENTFIENVFILLLTAIFWPCVMLLISYLSYLTKVKRRQNILSQSPFNKLSEIGFGTYPLHQDDKWQFTEMVPVVTWKNYEILMDVESRPIGYQIKFLAMVENSKIDEKRFSELHEFFTRKDMAFDFGGVSMYVKPKSITEINQIKESLDQLTSILENEFFTPAKTRLL